MTTFIQNQMADMSAEGMAPWEIEFMATGREPDPEHVVPFGMLYETDDWKPRWESARQNILAVWRDMPAARRPIDWIGYLADIGYLPREAAAELIEPGAVRVDAA